MPRLYNFHANQIRPSLHEIFIETEPICAVIRVKPKGRSTEGGEQGGKIASLGRIRSYGAHILEFVYAYDFRGNCVDFDESTLGGKMSSPIDTDVPAMRSHRRGSRFPHRSLENGFRGFLSNGMIVPISERKQLDNAIGSTGVSVLLLEDIFQGLRYVTDNIDNLCRRCRPCIGTGEAVRLHRDRRGPFRLHP